MGVLNYIPKEKLLSNPLRGKQIGQRQWTIIEDEILRLSIKELGTCDWKKISNLLLTRSPKGVAARWKKIAYGKKHGKWSKEEDLALRELLKKESPNWVNFSKVLYRSPKSISEHSRSLAFLYPESTGNKRQNIVKRENETNDKRKNHRSGDNIRNLATQKGIKLPRISWSDQEKEALRKAYLKFGRIFQMLL
ncbi:hypothetical protein G9A89_001057 [Geosiphon pyriformis]|nr:hypothetical protein G9A89_001057 [Geosiphon pyriformis]